MARQDRVKNIPGFYYDPTKRRYFRVRPGHNMHNPLTWELIAEEEEIRKRREIHQKSQSNHSTNNRLEGIPTLLRKRETNASYHGRAWQNEVTKKRVLGMRPRTVLCDGWCRAPNQILLDASQTRLFVACGCLNCFEVSPDSLELMHTTDHRIWNSELGIKHVALRPHLCEASSPVGIVVAEQFPAVLFDKNCRPMREVPRLMAGSRFTHCSWQRNTTRPTEVAMTRTSGKSIVLYDTEANSITKLPVVVQKSEVLCIEFMARSPVLVAGYRNGSVCALDLRAKHKTRSFSSFCMESSVGSLKMLRDENYVLAMGLNGQLNMYDFRVGKHVLQYKQHVGTHRQLSFCTNDADTLVFASGQDHVIRIWDIRNSQPIHQFVPELELENGKPIKEDQIPCVTYGNNLGGTTPGLLTSTDTSIHCYTI